MKDRLAVIVAGLSFGDEGKGSVVDFLSRQNKTHTVVRYNGGSQAAHNVLTPEGRHHTFSQFGSGTFVPGVSTHLSSFMLVNPLSMMEEERHLGSLGIRDAWDRTTIDRRSLVITPFARSVNRLRELARGEGRHGSCGAGIGETMSDFLQLGNELTVAGDLANGSVLRRKLEIQKSAKWAQIEPVVRLLPGSEKVSQELKVFTDPNIVDYIVELFEYFSRLVDIVDENYLGKLLSQPGQVVFEGAQGVLLDEWFGFHPFTTWSTTTFTNAQTLLDEAGYTGRTLKLGLVRSYTTRHGPGPFVTEDEILTSRLRDDHNGTNDWQREFRVGYFDAIATRYAIDVVGGVDMLAVSHLDRLPQEGPWEVCTSYQSDDDGVEIAKFFEVDGGLIRRIKVGRTDNLPYQQKLTELLGACVAQYRTLTKQGQGVEEYLSLLEELLGVPIGLVSFGPTASDKKWRRIRPTRTMSSPMTDLLQGDD